MKGDVTGMKERIGGILFAGDGKAALDILQEIYDDYDLEPVGFEPAEQFEGTYLKSNRSGFCKDCAEPYEEGETIWWFGPGKGAWCEGCKKTDEYVSVANSPKAAGERSRERAAGVKTPVKEKTQVKRAGERQAAKTGGVR